MNRLNKFRHTPSGRMIRLTFAERYQQARTYAAQVRVRKAMGQKYEHAAPWRGPNGIKVSNRRIVSASLETESSLA